MKIDTIKLNPNNPRKISDVKMAQLKESIKDFEKMLRLRPIIIDENNMALGGNMRTLALQELGYDEIPDDWVKKETDLTEDEKREFIIKDNIAFGENDWEALVDWDAGELEKWGMDLPKDFAGEYTIKDESRGKLAEKFLMPPFSVLDARQGGWINRKRAWIGLGIKSEIGRENNLLGSSPLVATINEGTSVFDPTLCELMYSWFAKPNSKIIDCFAGGSVRGIIANYLGHRYTGIELSNEQVTENIKQGKEILPDNEPNWINGDARDIKKLAGDGFDMLFSCPPYADLEVYSDDPKDLSTLGYEDFKKSYREIIKDCFDVLNDNSFACFVVGEIRDKNGVYHKFVNDTINAFTDAGFKYYNEIILVTSIGTLPIRVSKSFPTGRKIGKTHQNILVFYKGDPKEIKKQFPKIEIADLSELEVEDVNA